MIDQITDSMRAAADATEAAYFEARRRRAEAQRTRRLKAHTVAEPTVRTVDDNTVAVSLCGNRGRGREVLLDRDVWEAVSARLGTRWVIEPRKSGEFCVCVEGAEPVVPLDREVIEVPFDRTLMHRNRDVTDLRRCNLYTADLVRALSYTPNRLPRRTLPLDA